MRYPDATSDPVSWDFGYFSPGYPGLKAIILAPIYLYGLSCWHRRLFHCVPSTIPEARMR